MVQGAPPSPARARVKAFVQLGLLLVGGWFSIATSEGEICYYGTNIYDGQTNVAIDTLIRFDSNHLARDLPAITEQAAGLVLLPERTPIEVEYQLDPEGGDLTLVPKAPLQPGREYEAHGFDVASLETTNHFVSGSLTPVTVRFRTSAAPRALGVFMHPVYELSSHYLVVFSEAIDLTTVTPESLYFTMGGERLEAEVVGNYNNLPHILEFTLPLENSEGETPTPAPVPDQVEISTAVRGSSGVALDGDGDGTGGELEDGQRLIIGGTTYQQPQENGELRSVYLDSFLKQQWCTW